MLGLGSRRKRTRPRSIIGAPRYILQIQPDVKCQRISQNTKQWCKPFVILEGFEWSEMAKNVRVDKKCVCWPTNHLHPLDITYMFISVIYLEYICCRYVKIDIHVVLRNRKQLRVLENLIIAQPKINPSLRP